MSDELEAPNRRDPWLGLSTLTPARIALGRSGASLPTTPALDFAMAHARARDAIHTALDVEGLAAELNAAGFPTQLVTSQINSRAEYLLRPDLGRRLSADSQSRIDSRPQDRRLTVVIADGLSSLAPRRHALPLLTTLREGLANWQLDDIFLATQARVALGDEIGELRHAEAVLILIGERPGLQASDSLGAYLTYRPRVGCSDAGRNCVSNIRPGGLTFPEAARRLLYLLNGARALQQSGVALKDDSNVLPYGPTTCESVVRE
jgi:ethanolamine ammonia-lyase small subunit